jgi:predicted SnoaL-like aldol condensation-catalyzing enzyme
MIRRGAVRIMLEDHADSRLRVAAWMDREPDLEAVVGCARRGWPERRSSVSAEENKATQRRIIEEMINRKDLDLADELFSEEHELHPEAAGVARDPEGMKRAFAGLHEEFPDIRVEIEDMVAEGDTVAVLPSRAAERATRPIRNRVVRARGRE